MELQRSPTRWTGAQPGCEPVSRCTIGESLSYPVRLKRHTTVPFPETHDVRYFSRDRFRAGHLPLAGLERRSGLVARVGRVGQHRRVRRIRLIRHQPHRQRPCMFDLEDIQHRDLPMARGLSILDPNENANPAVAKHMLEQAAHYFMLREEQREVS